MKNVKVSKKSYGKIKSRTNEAGIRINYGITADGILEVESFDVPDDWDEKTIRKFKKQHGLCLGAVGTGYMLAATNNTHRKSAAMVNEDGSFYVDVVANTKEVLFAHGFKASEDMKYNMTEALLNAPIMLDHGRDVPSIIGRFQSMGADEDGLKLRLHYRSPDSVRQAHVYDALVAIRDGYAPAVSLGGYWLFDDSGTVATEALVHEVSSVWRGSDPLAGAFLSYDSDCPSVSFAETKLLKELDTASLWDLESYLKTL